MRPVGRVQRAVVAGAKAHAERPEQGGTIIGGGVTEAPCVGEEIPGLAEAHTYVEYDEEGKIAQVYEPIREQPWQYTDHY